MELVKSEVPYIKFQVDNNEFIIEGDENGKIGLGFLLERLRNFFYDTYDVLPEWKYEELANTNRDSLEECWNCNNIINSHKRYISLGRIKARIKDFDFIIYSDKEGKVYITTLAYGLDRFIGKVFGDTLEWAEYNPSLEEGVEISAEEEYERAKERILSDYENLKKEEERRKNEPPIKKYDVVNIPTDEEAARYTYYISEQREKGKIIDNESCYLDKCLVDVLCRIREACRREERSIEVSTDEITEGAIKAFEDAGYGITRWSLLGKDDNFVTISWGRWL